jgi:hypothetical protein
MSRSPPRTYQALLLALAVLFVAYPVTRDSTAARVAYDVLLSLIVLGVFLPVFPTARLRLLALAVGGPMLVVNWTGYVRPDLPLDRGVHALAALFNGLLAAMIVTAVSRQGRVTADSVNGALCGYLLIGIAFGHLYGLVESVAPGSFCAQGTLAAELQGGRRRFLLTYFSLTTLTTLGYGDITPATNVARSLAATEAILGQFYVAVLIAEFVGKRIAQPASDPPPGASREARPGDRSLPSAPPRGGPS